MTQDEFNALPPEAQATIRSGLLLQQMLADKEGGSAARFLAEKVAKKANPAFQTTEDLTAPVVNRVLAEVEKKLGERDQKTAQERAEAKLQEQIGSAISQHGYTDEGIKRILTRMQEKGVGDFETAMLADLQAHPNTPAVPPGSAEHMDWNFYPGLQQGDNADFFNGKLVGAPGIEEDPGAWARATALRYLDGSIKLPQ